MALFDQTVHTKPSANTTETYARVMKEVTGIATQNGTHPAAQFAHLTDYDAQARRPGGRLGARGAGGEGAPPRSFSSLRTAGPAKPSMPRFSQTAAPLHPSPTVLCLSLEPGVQR